MRASFNCTRMYFFYVQQTGAVQGHQGEEDLAGLVPDQRRAVRERVHAERSQRQHLLEPVRDDSPMIVGGQLADKQPFCLYVWNDECMVLQ